MPIPFPYDFKNPDYREVFQWRIDRCEEIKKNPKDIPLIKSFYRENPAQFIIDWGVTFDPRNPEIRKPSLIPFILYPRQEEWVHWCLERWRNREPGLSDKSRETGLSWLAIATSCAICLFNDGISIGFGSRKEEYVDKLGQPKSLFYKARQFVANVPYMFRGDWDERKDAPHMSVRFPATQSIISGEAGDGIGRGDRTSIYFVDESAHLERPQLVDASLSSTTNCRIDISTPRGMNNPFAKKRFGKNIKVFTMHWQDDPRKDAEWYAKKCIDLNRDEVTIAQEIDLDYTASVSGIVIPALWVSASIDSHIALGVKIKGIRKASLDIADQGPDQNAFSGRHGVMVDYLESFSGKGSDVFETTEKSLKLATLLGYDALRYDADGMGAAVRGDAKELKKRGVGLRVKLSEFHGGGKVVDPEGDPFGKLGERNSSVDQFRTNEDYYRNAKAQGWGDLRRRFQNTYRAVVKGEDFDPDDIISLSSGLACLSELKTELSQPTWGEDNSGKLVVDKTPDGQASPNYGDAVMMAFAKNKKPFSGMFNVSESE